MNRPTASVQPHISNHELPLTGERTIPGLVEENYWFRRHEIAYDFALNVVENKTVLEAGVGEGYGADLLASKATSVTGVDYDQSVVDHISRKYPNIHAICTNLHDLSDLDTSFDVIINFQVIEHLWDQDHFLQQCRNVLHPQGVLLISTPNRLTFSPGLDKPLNPFHTRELAPQELLELLHNTGFSQVTTLGVHHGPRLQQLDSHWGGSIIKAQLDAINTVNNVSGIRGELLADIASITSSDFVIQEPDLEQSLDLLYIASTDSLSVSIADKVPGR